MKNYAIFGSLVVVAFLLTWLSPVSSNALTSKYYQGYSDALTKVARSTESLPVKKSPAKVTSPSLTNTTAVSTTTTSTINYVANPMVSDLDLNQWRILNGNIFLENGRTGASPIRVNVYADRATGGNFLAGGVNSYALVATATSSNSYAGYFEGNVNIDGDLKIRPFGELIFGPIDSNPIGPTEDRWRITTRFDTHNDDWADFIMSSNDNIGMIIDANDDDPMSAFRIGAGDPPEMMYSGKELFTVRADGKVGIGNAWPSKTLDIFSEIENAEISIKTGDNTHWGIYQNGISSDLRFWHGDNRLIINDRGISTKGICLNNVCITSWSDLQNIINPPTPSKPLPYQPTQP